MIKMPAGSRGVGLDVCDRGLTCSIIFKNYQWICIEYKVKMTKKIIIVMFLLVFLSITFSRLPFLKFPLVGEEGAMSILMLSNDTASMHHVKKTESKCLLLAGKSDGKSVWASPERNITPYKFLCNVIGPTFSDYYFSKSNDSISNKTSLSRITFFLITSVGILSLLILGYLKSVNFSVQQRLYICLFSFYVFTTPLALGGSIQPQLDGSIGVLIFGLLSLMLYLSGSKYLNIFSKDLLLFNAGVVSALGKNEWAYAFFGAHLIIVILGMLNKMICRDQYCFINYRTLLFTCGGIFFGVLISWILSPNDYMAWFDVARRTNKSFNALDSFIANLNYIYPVVILGFLAFTVQLQSFIKKSVSQTSLVLFLAGLLIFMAYMGNGWPGDGFPRYYIPPLVLFFASLLCSDFLSALQRGVTLKQLYWVTILFTLINVTSLANSYINFTSITSSPGKPLQLHLEKIHLINSESKTSPNAVYFYDSSLAYYYPDISFMGSDLGWDSAKELTEKNYPGKVLVKK